MSINMNDAIASPFGSFSPNAIILIALLNFQFMKYTVDAIAINNKNPIVL